MEHTVRLLHIGFVTHDVRQLVVERPDGLEFKPGQGVEMAIDADGWRDEGRPFTPTSRPDEPVLEFTIKSYPQRDAVTDELDNLEAGATLLMSGEAFGTITDHGPGVMLAGGAGVTPFLSILRNRADPKPGRKGKADPALEGYSLHFSNKTPADVICEKEFRHLLGDHVHFTCDEKSGPGYDDRMLDRDYLEDVIDDFGQRFYVCGPPAFVESLQEALVELGADEDRIVVEE